MSSKDASPFPGELDNANRTGPLRRSGSRIGGTAIRFEEILGSVASILVAVDEDRSVIYWNPLASETFNVPCARAIGTPLSGLALPWQAGSVQEALERCGTTGQMQRLGDLAYTTRLGTAGVLGLTVSPLKNAQGTRAGYLIQGADITERVRLERDFLQAQKMDAIGRLAGTIAHDFNNILTIVIGLCDLMLNVPFDEARRLEKFREIRECAERGSELTHQLLSFSRKQSAPSAMDSNLNAIVTNSLRILKKAVGEAIALEVETKAAASRVQADPIHITQVLLNLAVNARDAMPGGGRLRIVTETPQPAPRPEGSPGEWVRLIVSDTGEGMSAEVRERMFEPFFTTKGKERGTGLGLSTVYGIVNQAGGHIRVSTQPGQGTTFEILFHCRPDAPATDTPQEPASTVRWHGTETILLVEDDPGVLSIVGQLLTNLGYRVLAAANGQEALNWARREDGIALLLTDWKMPGMDGLELAGQIRAIRPSCRILVISGHAGADTSDRPSACNFIWKPFSLAEVASKVRAVLDAEERGPSGPS